MADNLVSTRTKIYTNEAGTRIFNELTLPTGITQYYSRRFSGIEYRKRKYAVGKYSRGLAFYPEDVTGTSATLTEIGLTASGSAPSAVTDGAGAITATVIYYIAPVHITGSVTLHEGNLSSGSSPLVCSSNDTVVTVPGTAPDARTSHWRLYRSDSGALPRKVTDITIGTTTYNDNTATGALGATPPLNAAGDAVAGRRGVPPYTRWIVKWHNRAWYGGDPNFPYRVWFSEIDEFESVGSSNYVETRDGEPVTGMAPVGDELLIFCMQATYQVRGYRASDFVVSKIHTSLGCISHFSICTFNDNQREKCIFASQRGPILYDQSFHDVFEDWATFWEQDYGRFHEAYEESVAIIDYEKFAYRLLIPVTRDWFGSTVRSWYYVGSYLRWHPSLIGGPPQMDWTIDMRGRLDSGIGYLADTSGRRIVYTGSCDGYIRRENVDDDPDDDGDSFQKRLRIKTRTESPPAGMPGDEKEGATWLRVWIFLENEFNAVTNRLWSGNEKAAEETSLGEQPTPHFTETIPAGASSGLVPRTLWPQVPKLGGGTLTLELTATSPKRVVFRGWGTDAAEGPLQRSADT